MKIVQLLKKILIVPAIMLMIAWPLVSRADDYHHDDHDYDRWHHDHRDDHDYDRWHHDHDRWHHYSYVGFDFNVWPNTYDETSYYHPVYYPPPAQIEPPSGLSYQAVVINGNTYYMNNGDYYIYTGFGYQLVDPPESSAVLPVPTSPIQEEGDSFTVNVPNSKGDYTPVVIKKSGTGYVGPQGEFYAQFPTVTQLKAMYGQ